MKLGFYRAFEDKYRGSRELIKSRLRAYLPFLTPLKEAYGDCKALDVGCGRGEWLELLKELGIDAHGIDLDDDMLAACRALGLSVETGEAVSYIKSIPSESLAVVSGFHFAEHIPFTDLQIFVQEALRVLQPAGLLILETPNPENIVVGTSSFYLDPTHEHPIPPQLLSFLPEYYGFYRTKVLRLQEIWELRGDSDPSLFNVLSGVSPDYSVVAQKSGNEDVISTFQDAFEIEYGLTLDELAGRYDVLKKNRLDQVFAEKENVQAELNGVRTELGGVRTELGGVLIERANLRAELNNLSTHYQNALNEINRLRVELDKTVVDQANLQVEFNAREKELMNENQKLLKNTTNLDQELSRAKIELISVYSSTSWKITSPVRYTKTVLSTVIRIPQRAIKGILNGFVRFMRAHPGIKEKLVRLLAYFPMIDKMVLRLSRRVMNESSENLGPDVTVVDESQNISLRAQQIHKDLLNAIEKDKTGR